MGTILVTSTSLSPGLSVPEAAASTHNRNETLTNALQPSILNDSGDKHECGALEARGEHPSPLSWNYRWLGVSCQMGVLGTELVLWGRRGY